MMSDRPDFVTECYGKNNTEIKKESQNNNIKEQKVELAEDSVDEKNNSITMVFIFFFITILNLFFSVELIGSKISSGTWNSVADPAAAEKIANRNSKMVSYYDRFHSLFLGVAVVGGLVAIYSLFTKKNLLAILMSIFMIISNGFVIYLYLFL